MTGFQITRADRSVYAPRTLVINTQAHPLASLPQLGQGAGGAVFALGDRYVAKLFHCPAPLESKIQALQAKPLPAYVAPPQILIRDHHTDEFLGYVMPRVEITGDVRTLIQAPVTLQSLQTLVRFIQQVQELHTRYGMVIGDFNPENFVCDSARNVRFIDVDAWGFGDYVTTTTHPTYYDARYTPRSGLPLSNENDRFALYEILFHFLLKVPAFGGVCAERCKRARSAQALTTLSGAAQTRVASTLYLLRHLPSPVRVEFEKVFHGLARPAITPRFLREISLFVESARPGSYLAAAFAGQYRPSGATVARTVRVTPIPRPPSAHQSRVRPQPAKRRRVRPQATAWQVVRPCIRELSVLLALWSYVSVFNPAAVVNGWIHDLSGPLFLGPAVLGSLNGLLSLPWSVLTVPLWQYFWSAHAQDGYSVATLFNLYWLYRYWYTRP